MPWRSAAYLVFVAALGAALPAAALPPAPTREEMARRAECTAFEPTGVLSLTLRGLEPAPEAPAVLNYRWGVRLEPPDARLGRVVGMVHLWDHRMLLAATDTGYWIAVPLAADGSRLEGASATAAPIRDLKEPPVDLAIALSGPEHVWLGVAGGMMGYDIGACALKARPYARVRIPSGQTLRRLVFLGRPVEIVSAGAAGQRSATHEPTGSAEVDQVAPLGEPSRAERPGYELVDESYFELARGCDRLAVWRKPGGPGSVLLQTYCTGSYLKLLEELRRSPRRGHRSPRPVLSPSDVGVIGAPVRAVAYGLPDFAGMDTGSPVAEGDPSHTGAPTWLYMASQSDAGGVLDILAFRPQRAVYPMGIGGSPPPFPPAF